MQPNNVTLKIRPMAAKKVAASALEVYRRLQDGWLGSNNEQDWFLCRLSVPDDIPYDLAAVLIGWVIYCRHVEWEAGIEPDRCPSILYRGSVYDAERSVEVCGKVDRILSELQDFADSGDVLEAVYEEPLLDRILQPLQLIHNLDMEEPSIRDERQVDATQRRIQSELETYGPDFV